MTLDLWVHHLSAISEAPYRQDFLLIDLHILSAYLRTVQRVIDQQMFEG